MNDLDEIDDLEDMEDLKENDHHSRLSFLFRENLKNIPLGY